MKKLLIIPAFMLFSAAVTAQPITIDANDMPVAGDTLRYSVVAPTGGVVDLTITGANTSWDFSSLTPIMQGVDTYRTAIQQGYPSLGNAYGHPMDASAFGVPLPPSVEDPYTFYKKLTSPQSFVLFGYGLKFNGFPVPMEMDDPDDIYFFPLNFNDVDSSNFLLDFSLLTNSIKQEGYRKTTVDGWGTIVTPHFTTPVSCLRVKSFVSEVDTIVMGGPAIPLTRTYYEYKWLAENEHYPVLIVNTILVGSVEGIMSVRFRDHYRASLSVLTPSVPLQVLTVWPNPAKDAVTIALPMDWKNYTVELFDVQGRLLARQQNNAVINIEVLPAGNYVARITAEHGTGYANIVK
jgi:hypothetical protein